MAELIIFTAMAIGMILTEVVPKVFWLDEDWRHLRIADSWDASASRGRVVHRSEW